MMPNMDPKQMQKLMKQMGINSREIDAKRVLIETDNEQIIVSEPQVMEIDMKGQKSFQISGKVEVNPLVSKEDLKLIMEQTGANEESAEKALRESNGDIAEAILKLKT